jgi:hypothetical protein
MGKSMDELFEGRHFDREVIILCVRRYPRPVNLCAGWFRQHELYSHTVLRKTANHADLA